MYGKVLCADDMPAMRAFITATLESDFSLQVREAADGQEALDIALEWRPDVVFLDVLMPKKNGFEVCHILKNDPRTRSSKVVILSRITRSSTGQSTGEDEADEYLMKPFGPDDLLRKFYEISNGGVPPGGCREPMSCRTLPPL